ncbi:hypothetical protein BSKO_04465 [Bryopsis sp. KO-2023]|nr:hypothetical protein BSKO_04465 [Bryopsis sp. KO-2023]
MIVNVKWGKEVFKEVEVDMDQPPLVFKTQLYTLSGVPPDRCKVMVKGKLLGDETWTGVKLKEGQQMMMMGSPDAVPVVAPEKAPVFLEDLPEEEQDAAPLAGYGAGLKNLGNTCYMNSTLQCLYAVPELRRALQTYTERGNPADPSDQLTTAAAGLFREIDRSRTSVLPVRFLLTLRTKFPQFSETGEGGIYKQQDAEECWSQVVHTLGEKLQGGKDRSVPVIKELFGLDFETDLVCKESSEVIFNQTNSTKLVCVIPFFGAVVNHLHEGIEESLKADREQISEALGKNVLFEGTSKITRLPPYLVVQMVRFYYRRDTQQKAKILKKIPFPETLDTYKFCCEELQSKLDGPRKRTEQLREAEIAAKNPSKSEPKNGDENGAGVSGSGETQDGDGDTVMGEGSSSISPVVDGTMTGMYELFGLLTHKGRSADSGHYVGWVKEQDGQWIQFDDDTMIPMKNEDIMKLNGGGDWHMAYLLLYRAKTVEMEDVTTKES